MTRTITTTKAWAVAREQAREAREQLWAVAAQGQAVCVALQADEERLRAVVEQGQVALEKVRAAEAGLRALGPEPRGETSGFMENRGTTDRRRS